jgi:hypothetical protein
LRCSGSPRLAGAFHGIDRHRRNLELTQTLSGQRKGRCGADDRTVTASRTHGGPLAAPLTM